MIEPRARLRLTDCMNLCSPSETVNITTRAHLSCDFQLVTVAPAPAQSATRQSPFCFILSEPETKNEVRGEKIICPN